MIYLDNSATTKPCSEAVEAMTLALTENWGNPSALYNFGFDAAHQLRDARHKVAANETLTKISRTYYGDNKLWPYIVKFNNMRNPNGLGYGMEIGIPRLVPKK